MQLVVNRVHGRTEPFDRMAFKSLGAGPLVGSVVPESSAVNDSRRPAPVSCSSPLGPLTLELAKTLLLIDTELHRPVHLVTRILELF